MQQTKFPGNRPAETNIVYIFISMYQKIVHLKFSEPKMLCTMNFFLLIKNVHGSRKNLARLPERKVWTPQIICIIS